MARILVIDDETNIALVLKIMLSDEGHAVVTASDGLSGLEKVRQFLPDIVLVDLNIPVISGQALVEKIRSDPKLKNIPVIIISGSMYNSKDFPPKNSYQAFFTKPFDLWELAKTVEVLTEKSEHFSYPGYHVHSAG